MVQGGTANPTNSDGFIENVVRYISEKEDLLQKLQDQLTLKGFEKKGETFNESTIKHVSQLLVQNPDLLKVTIDIVKDHLEKDDNQLKTLLEQVNKVKGMEKELETLGNQLLAQGLISGAAVTTLTGALAGLLTVGGVTGALIVGGAAFLEPVHNLFRSKAAKARTTICRLVLSFRSQFFHNRLHFCNQAKDLSTTHLFGNTTKVCNSFRFITSTVAPIVAFICVAKFSPV